MALFNSFTFNGIRSLQHGVYITGEAVFNAPERVIEMIAVPGKNGALAIDQGYFQNIDVTYPAGCFADTLPAFADKLADFRNMLLSEYTYKRLTDTYHPDEYRLALYKSGLNVDPAAFNTAGEFDLVFDCKPQRWLLSGEQAQVYTSSGQIINPTWFDAKPLLKITGAGDLTLGSQVMTIANGSGSGQVIYVDCETQEAWEMVGGVMIARNDYIQNAGEEFPVLSGGVNSVILGSGITRVEITPRWWRI